MGLVIALVLADRAGLFGRAPKGDVATYDGRTFRVARVIDGDTLDVDVPDGGRSLTRIRLWGVDTPEVETDERPADPFGPQASQYAKALVQDKWVRLQLETGRPTRGKYGRLLAYVHLPDGRMLNRLLVAGGYGYADPRFDHSHKDEFAHLQQQAVTERRGLWRNVKRSDIPSHLRGKVHLPGR